jgi:glycosyltransferase involved in cell wall biosynthesis
MVRDADILAGLPTEYVLGASRFVRYKRLDLVIEAGEAVGLPVVLAGSGPEEGLLRERAATARTPVHFVLKPSNELLYALFQNALVFVFPAVEDFGIMPVEAMACGTPTIVGRLGGAVESVSLLDGGAVFEVPAADEFRRAIDKAAASDRGTTLSERTSRFSRQRFRREVQSWVAAEAGRERDSARAQSATLE